jgi:hypothetical protein
MVFLARFFPALMIAERFAALHGYRVVYYINLSLWRLALDDLTPVPSTGVLSFLYIFAKYFD